MQLARFCLGIVISVYGFLYEGHCVYSIVYPLVIILLFSNYYYHAFLCPPRRKPPMLSNWTSSIMQIMNIWNKWMLFLELIQFCIKLTLNMRMVLWTYLQMHSWIPLKSYPATRANLLMHLVYTNCNADSIADCQQYSAYYSIYSVHIIILSQYYSAEPLWVKLIWTYILPLLILTDILALSCN